MMSRSTSLMTTTKWVLAGFAAGAAVGALIVCIMRPKQSKLKSCMCRALETFSDVVQNFSGM